MPECSRSSSPTEQFEMVYKPTFEPIGSILDEAKKASSLILETYPDLKPCIFFSGGIDSEIMLRSFIDLKANFDLFVVRYEDDLNIHDVSYAYSIASSLNLEIKVLDLNIKKFFENDAERVVEEAQCDRPRMLPQLAFGHMVDGLPILAGGDMTWSRTDDDYSKKGTWHAVEFEHDIAWDRYYLFHNRPAVYSWQRWTPGNLVAHMNTSWFRRLINDGYRGRIANTSTKMDCFNEAISGLINRKKHHGLEKCDRLVDELENTILQKYGCFPYRRQQTMLPDLFYKAVTGQEYNEVRNLL